MSRSLKITLCTAGVLAGIIALVAIATLFFVDLGGQKPRLEAAASAALGMQVTVGGHAGIGIFPRLHVTLEDVHIRNTGADTVAAERADLGIDFLSLFLLKIRFAGISLERYRISIERDVHGKFNFEAPKESQAALPALDLANVVLSDGSFHYANKQAGGGFEAGHCNLHLKQLQYAGGKRSDLPKGLSMTGEFACREMQIDDLTMSDLKSPVNAKDGIFEFEPLTMLIFGAKGSGNVQMDQAGPTPRVRVSYSLPQFPIEEFLKTLSPKTVAHGPMEFSAKLTMQGSTMEELRRTMNGEASLKGENLTLDGRDLDKEFAKYESTQNFNLVDVGAFFFAGPVGLAVTKGYNFTSLLQGSGGSTRIRTLVSSWKVERGVAHAQDVALTTDKNRLALQGGLDFGRKEFADVTVALIDAKGCPMVLQKIHGPFAKPVVDKPNFLKSIAGPAFKLLKKARDLFPGGECNVFYEGSVKPPE